MSSNQQGGSAVAERDTDSGRLGSVKSSVSSALGDARDRASDGYHAAVSGVSDAYEAARDRASAAYASAREAAAGAGERAVAGVQENPLGALVGGIALGAIVGALLPRSEREVAALAPLGTKLRDAASTAGGAAKKQAIGKLAEFGISGDLVDKAKDIIGQGGAKSSDGDRKEGGESASSS